MTKTSQPIASKSLTSKTVISGSFALLTVLPTLAFSHSGHNLLATDTASMSSILSGILHPLTGLDHLMLALGMGMLLTQMHRFKRGLASLAIGLVVGFALGLSVNLNSTFIEFGIVLSIVLLTLALMSRYFNIALNQSYKASVKTWHNLAIIGFGALATFHGAAHAIEIPASSYTAGFFIGMIIAMLGLYTIGKGVAIYLNHHLQDSLIVQRVIAGFGLCAVLLS